MSYLLYTFAVSTLLLLAGYVVGRALRRWGRLAVRSTCDVCGEPASVWMTRNRSVNGVSVPQRSTASCLVHAPDVGMSARMYWNGGEDNDPT